MSPSYAHLYRKICEWNLLRMGELLICLPLTPTVTARFVNGTSAELGESIFFRYFEVFFIERYVQILKSTQCYIIHYERFFTVGGVYCRRFHCTHKAYKRLVELVEHTRGWG